MWEKQQTISNIPIHSLGWQDVSNENIEAGYVTPDGELLNDRFVKANQATSTQFPFVLSEKSILP